MLIFSLLPLGIILFSKPGGGSPYKISVAHARRKSADIGVYFPARRGPAFAIIRGLFSPSVVIEGMGVN